MLKHNGIYYPKDNNSAVIKSLLSGRQWEARITDIMKTNVKNWMVCVDAGAYIGTHTLLLSSLSKHTFAFEPNEPIFKCLKKTIDEKNIDNITLFRCGLFNNKTKLLFGSNGDGDSKIISSSMRRRYKEYRHINTITLDSLQLEQLDFIKIDVESSEWQLIDGAMKTLAKYRPMIVLETFNTNKNLQRLREFCCLLDYDLTKINNENYFLKPNNIDD